MPNPKAHQAAPPRTHCPVCRRQYTRTGDAIVTKDHIMPVAWGGSSSFYGGGLVDRIYRAMCQRCNCSRGAVGHCIGALACVLAVADTECLSVGKVIRRWRFSAVRPVVGGRRMRAWIRRAGLGPRTVSAQP